MPALQLFPLPRGRLPHGVPPGSAYVLPAKGRRQNLRGPATSTPQPFHARNPQSWAQRRWVATPGRGRPDKLPPTPKTKLHCFRNSLGSSQSCHDRATWIPCQQSPKKQRLPPRLFAWPGPLLCGHPPFCRPEGICERGHATLAPAGRAFDSVDMGPSSQPPPAVQSLPRPPRMLHIFGGARQATLFGESPLFG